MTRCLSIKRCCGRNCVSIDTVWLNVTLDNWLSIDTVQSIDRKLLEYRHHDRSMRWNCLNIDTVRSINALELLEYWYRTIDGSRWIENCLGIDPVRSIDRKLLEYRTLVWYDVALLLALSRSIENCLWSRSKLLEYRTLEIDQTRRDVMVEYWNCYRDVTIEYWRDAWILILLFS